MKNKIPRRKALASLGAIAAGSIILPQALTGCDKGPYKYELFNWGDTEWFDGMAEFILPQTSDSAGGKTAQVGEFVQKMVTDCLGPELQTTFTSGLAAFRGKIEETYNSHFLDLSPEEKATVMNELRTEASKNSNGPHFYNLMHSLVLRGFFTSEKGMNEALRYVPIPGEQKGIVPYNGEKAWAL